MKRYNAPKLENKLVCIISDGENTVLPTIVSSYFNDPATYFPVFKFPDINRAYTESASFDEDDFVSFMIGSSARTVINNAIARLHCQRVLLVGLNDLQKSYFQFLPQVWISLGNAV